MARGILSIRQRGIARNMGICDLISGYCFKKVSPLGGVFYGSLLCKFIVPVLEVGLQVGYPFVVEIVFR